MTENNEKFYAKIIQKKRSLKFLSVEKMVTGIKMISQQQVINSNTMGLSGLTAAQIPSQEAPVKRATTASDTRRVSLDGEIRSVLCGTEKWLQIISIFRDQLVVMECAKWFNWKGSGR